MKRFLTTLALLIGLAAHCLGQKPDELPGPKNPSEMDRFILDGMKEAKVPGLAVSVVKKDKVLWTGAYGWANREQKIPVTDDTLFQVASVSKPVTACAVMQLVEQGKLSLDADVNEVLPFPVRNPKHPKVPITLEHLLTHTSGIRDNWNLLEDTWVKNGDFPKPLGESLAAYLQPKGEYYSAKKSFYQWAPGTKSQYSNVGVALAAYLAEAKAKTSFETLCQKGIFDPLGMQGSSFRLKGMDQTKLAMPYGFKKKTGVFKPLGHHGYLDFPSGTLRVTAPHLARFLLSFIGDGQLEGTRLLKTETVRQMRKIPFPKADSKQGLVWYFDKLGGAKTMGHDGGDPGVSTVMQYRIKDDVGYVILQNGEPKNGKFEQALGQRLMKFAEGL
ncbi:MAG: serine hydrolase [Opitutales bacterium]|nr:serine hydrolase [Opitutales bacterium]